jgi:hypothetical protein
VAHRIEARALPALVLVALLERGVEATHTLAGIALQAAQKLRRNALVLVEITLPDLFDRKLFHLAGHPATSPAVSCWARLYSGESRPAPPRLAGSLGLAHHAGPKGLAMPDVVLCADLGTQSLRVGAVTARGSVAAAATAPLATADAHPGQSMADPQAWWHALAAAVAATLAKLPTCSVVRGVCLCGPTRAQVLLDRDGHTLAPAPLFRDVRAVDAATGIASYFPADNPADAITPFHPLARVGWLALREPALFERVAAVLEPKDFLNFRLTGTRAADASRIRASTRCARSSRCPRGFNAASSSSPCPAACHGRRSVSSNAASRRSIGSAGCRCSPAPWTRGRAPSARVPSPPPMAYDVGGTSEAGRFSSRANASSCAASCRCAGRGHASGRRSHPGRRGLRGVVPRDVSQRRHACERRRARRQPAARHAAAPAFLPYLAGERNARVARGRARRVRRRVAGARARRFPVGGARRRRDERARHPRDRARRHRRAPRRRGASPAARRARTRGAGSRPMCSVSPWCAPRRPKPA